MIKINVDGIYDNTENLEKLNKKVKSLKLGDMKKSLKEIKELLQAETIVDINVQESGFVLLVYRKNNQWIVKRVPIPADYSFSEYQHLVNNIQKTLGGKVYADTPPGIKLA